MEGRLKEDIADWGHRLSTALPPPCHHLAILQLLHRMCVVTSIERHKLAAICYQARTTEEQPSSDRCAAAVLQACSGSGHHLECPPAVCRASVLQCGPAPCSAPAAAGPRHDQQQTAARGRDCCQVLVIFISGTELKLYTWNRIFEL